MYGKDNSCLRLPPRLVFVKAGKTAAMLEALN